MKTLVVNLRKEIIYGRLMLRILFVTGLSSSDKSVSFSSGFC